MKEESMTNPYRGEVNIKLKDEIYIMRPSFQALCEIEDNIGKSIIVLLSQFQEKGITVKEQVTILKAGIKASKRNPPDNLEEAIAEAGVLNILPIICKFLERGLGL